MESEDEPSFGELDESVEYRFRPSTYAVIRDVAGRIAAVRAPRGTFLPGGGLERDEAPRDAVVREVEEETGLIVEVRAELGVATEYVRAGRDLREDLAKRSTFFRAAVVGESEPLDADHTLVWLPEGQLGPQLRYESHVWAIRLDEVG